MLQGAVVIFSVNSQSTEVKDNRNREWRGWRDDSGVKNTVCSRPGSLPSAHVAAHELCNLSFRGFEAVGHACGTQTTCTQSTPSFRFPFSVQIALYSVGDGAVRVSQCGN